MKGSMAPHELCHYLFHIVTLNCQSSYFLDSIIENRD